MTTTIGGFNKRPAQKQWQRIILLTILGYEAAGCLSGGLLLITAPDGRYMDMPVELMHGTFSDFFIPGIILFGLGIINTLAFFSVFGKNNFDWLMSGIALGGLLIWFIVEIIILKELHWLHLMWGYPVLLGWAVIIPLIILRNDTEVVRKILLSCGIISSVWYIAINIAVTLQYTNYNVFTMTVSELSAIGTSTRILWVLLAVFYLLLLLTFGWGILNSAEKNHRLRVAGSLIIAYSIFNFYWPPMHQREVIAAGNGTLTDTLHIIWAVVTLLFNILIMAFGAVALGKQFRLYTIMTWAVFIVFGVLTFKESSGIEANLPTPHIGLWERINMVAFLLWISVFSIVLTKRNENTSSLFEY